MVGIDLVEVQKIKEFISDKSDEQLLRVFTDKEIAYSRSVKNQAQRFAARFAVKEAFFKAFQFGNFNEIELDRQGKALFITLYGDTHKQWQSMDSPLISVSVSHTDSYATAIVLY